MKWYRPPVVAGRFYPKEVSKLTGFLHEVVIPEKSPLSALAIMAPHAGYLYSGRFAGDVYSKVEVPKTVILLCPNHTGKGPRISIWSEGEWETPLGRVPVETKLSHEMMKALRILDGDMLAHIYEHAIEVQLPFLQMKQPNLKIVPIVLGHLSFDKCLELGTVLADCISKRDKTLIVASSDMSHYISANEAKLKDQLALQAIREMDPQKLYETVLRNEISMCGFIPTTVALIAAKRLGATQSKLVSYGNSGEVTGELDSVVAYANAIFH